jgi:DNA-binding transcriptional MocR family regulator
VVLTELLTYDLARRIFVDRGLAVRGVPLDPDVLTKAVATEERRIAFLYVLPTFHNPTGSVMSRARRTGLLEAARELGLLIVEDDPYTDLALTPAASIPSLAGLAGYRDVIRLCTASKSLAPGLRLGWLLTDAERCSQMTSSGMFASGGGLNHLAALATATLLESGAYDRHVRWLRAELRARRDALLTPLRSGLPHFSFTAARGGFFIWVELPPARTETDVLEAAIHAGVLVAAGSRFGDTGRPAIRLSFSFHNPERLAEAARRLIPAWQSRP